MSWSCAAVLGCRDVHASADWFSTVLGFEFGPDGIFEPEEEGEPVYAIGRREGVGVHLQTRRRELYPEAREQIEWDAYFYVDDADALFAEYTAKGVTVHFPICDEEYGMRDFAIVDPDGHRLGFGSPR